MRGLVNQLLEYIMRNNQHTTNENNPGYTTPDKPGHPAKRIQKQKKVYTQGKTQNTTHLNKQRNCFINRHFVYFSIFKDKRL